ncbi:MAG: hypothetical protein ACD_73C00700G0004 [uncultured bacterium]|nr:MAG: hypothetical protein ACD_73C00700G0004 [uncultured bacterium]
MKIKLLLLNIPLFCLFLACGSEPNKSSDLKIKQTQKNISSKKNVQNDLREEKIQLVLQETLGAKSQVKKIDDKFVAIIDPQILWQEDDLVHFMIQLGQKMPGKLPELKSMLIETSGLNKTILKARYNYFDAKQFAEGAISKPEWMRRTQISVEETIESLTLKIRTLKASNNLPEMITALNQLISLDASNGKAWALLGNALRDLHKTTEAIEVYKKLVNQSGFEFFAFWNMGYCFDQLGLLGDSEQAYVKSIELDPSNAILMRQLAIVYLKENKVPEALDWLRKSKFYEINTETYWIEALILRHEKKFKEARDLLSKINMEGVLQASLLFNKILMDLDVKDFEAAKKKFAELKNLSPELAQEFSVVSLLSNL